MGSLRNLGTNNYLPSTAVRQLLLGFEKRLLFTREVGARGASQAGQRHTQRNPGNGPVCVEGRSVEQGEARLQSAQAEEWERGHLLNQWFPNIGAF